MSKVTGIDGPASEALFQVLNGGEYTSTQFGLLRNKKTGECLNNSGNGTTRRQYITYPLNTPKAGAFIEDLQG